LSFGPKIDVKRAGNSRESGEKGENGGDRLKRRVPYRKRHPKKLDSRIPPQKSPKNHKKPKKDKKTQKKKYEIGARNKKLWGTDWGAGKAYSTTRNNHGKEAVSQNFSEGY